MQIQIQPAQPRHHPQPPAPPAIQCAQSTTDCMLALTHESPASVIVHYPGPSRASRRTDGWSPRTNWVQRPSLTGGVASQQPSSSHGAGRAGMLAIERAARKLSCRVVFNSRILRVYYRTHDILSLLTIRITPDFIPGSRRAGARANTRTLHRTCTGS